MPTPNEQSDSASQAIDKRPVPSFSDHLSIVNTPSTSHHAPTSGQAPASNETQCSSQTSEDTSTRKRYRESLSPGDVDDSDNESSGNAAKRRSTAGQSVASSQASRAHQMLPPPTPNSNVSRARGMLQRATVGVANTFHRSQNGTSRPSQRQTRQSGVHANPQVANNSQSSRPPSVTSHPAQQQTAQNGVYANPQLANNSQASLNSQASKRSGLLAPGATPFRSADFHPGQIIYAPHHVTALKPGANPATDSNFVQSDFATICSKRRKMVVLWAYKNKVFALPCETHTKSGVGEMPIHLKDEFVCV